MFAELVEVELQAALEGTASITREVTLEAGRARLADGEFDAILLDLTLPDTDGIETVRAIRATSPGTAVVVNTVAADPDLARAALREGAQDYLRKGYTDGAAVAQALEFAIERQRALSAADQAAAAASAGATALGPEDQSRLQHSYAELLAAVTAEGEDVEGSTVAAKIKELATELGGLGATRADITALHVAALAGDPEAGDPPVTAPVGAVTPLLLALMGEALDYYRTAPSGGDEDDR